MLKLCRIIYRIVVWIKNNHYLCGKYNLIMEKKTYKDLKDGDTVYIVDGSEVFEELTIKIREVQYHPRIEEIQYLEMIEEDDKLYVLDLFNKDGIKQKYHWEQSVAMFKDATNTHDYEYWDELWGLVCFFNREDAVDYYKKSIKEHVKLIDKEIEKLEKRRSEHIEILNSFK